MESRVSPLELLANRIRAEYREMPGLCLTVAQACRLWQMDATTCTIVLETLVEEGVLIGRPDGKFVALATTPIKALKTDVSPIHLRRGA